MAPASEPTLGCCIIPPGGTVGNVAPFDENVAPFDGNACTGVWNEAAAGGDGNACGAANAGNSEDAPVGPAEKSAHPAEPSGSRATGLGCGVDLVSPAESPNRSPSKSVPTDKG